MTPAGWGAMGLARLTLGAHLSIARGLPEAVALAGELGCDTFQFFTRNPRGGARREIAPDEIQAWRAARAQRGMFPVLAHLPYTVNLASPKPDAYRFARRCVAEDLQRLAAIDTELAVCHPGSHGGAGLEAGIERIVRLLDGVLAEAPSGTMLCLETMSGQGTEVGGRPEELERILDALGWPAGMGVCVDSCHVFAAGFDVRTHAGCDRLCDALDATVGLDRVKCVHLNDSVYPCGSRRDRHAKVGQGMLGPDGVAAFASHRVFGALPMVLETPVDDVREYGPEVAEVRRLVAAGPAPGGYPAAGDRGADHAAAR